MYLFILRGFAWSALVSYSKKLHLRTMKPAGLPPMKDTAGLPHIQENRNGPKGPGGNKKMTDKNINAYRFPTHHGDTLPTIS